MMARSLPLAVLATLLLGAKSPSAAPHAARIAIHKTRHVMEVTTSGSVDTYLVSLGPGGPGFKHREGDRVTPVGHYHVVSRTRSVFTIFMRLDYPNADDWKRFAQLKASGELPKDATIGGDIGIHGGTPVGLNH